MRRVRFAPAGAGKVLGPSAADGQLHAAVARLRPVRVPRRAEYHAGVFGDMLVAALEFFICWVAGWPHRWLVFPQLMMAAEVLLFDLGAASGVAATLSMFLAGISMSAWAHLLATMTCFVASCCVPGPRISLIQRLTCSSSRTIVADRTLTVFIMALTWVQISRGGVRYDVIWGTAPHLGVPTGALVYAANKAAMVLWVHATPLLWWVAGGTVAGSLVVALRGFTHQHDQWVAGLVLCAVVDACLSVAIATGWEAGLLLKQPGDAVPLSVVHSFLAKSIGVLVLRLWLWQGHS
jgi:hypothetical protein